MTLFISLILIGLLLIGLEVFLPGGILGIIGFVCLGGAVVTAFFEFEDPVYGLIALIGALLIGCGYFGLLLTVLPKSRLWRTFNLESEIAATAANEETTLLLQIGAEGTAVTDLRPSGIITIDGRRHDVVASTGFVAAGSQIRVESIAGFRVVVRPLDTINANEPVAATGPSLAKAPTEAPAPAAQPTTGPSQPAVPELPPSFDPADPT